jgi:nucleotide-binding universal stress UspA family protein
MYRKILFAVADDEALAGAVPVVAAYARTLGAAVHVLHVHRIDLHAPSLPGRELVAGVVERIRSEGVAAEGEVRLLDRGDSVPRAIARFARRDGADLVAIGSHGRSDLGALFLGSVSNAVASGLDVPVLVVRTGAHDAALPRTVLVAVDGSDASDHAVAEAGDVARDFHANVVVLNVRQVIAVDATAVVPPEDEAQAVVRRAVVALGRRGLAARGETLVDRSVPAAIAWAAERHHADLVVLGSRRPSDLSGLLLGSVAHDVVHRLRCPVLLAGRAAVAEAVS